MVRGRDACWEHCVLVDATRQKVRCNYCHRDFSGGVYRMKFHLAQIKNKDIVPCTEVPTDVRDQINSILTTPRKQRNPKKSKVDRQQHSSSASGGVNPNHGSSGPCDSASPTLLFPSEQPILDDAQTEKHEGVDKKIANFFFFNSIPFSATKSSHYQEMVDAIADCGVGYVAPSFEQLSSSLLEKTKNDINDCYNRHTEEWKETGCTILCNSLPENGNNTKSIVAFSISCSKGTVFFKSVDISGHADDAPFLFELLESVVLEIGVENVVQVITDSATSYIYAGRLLMSKYTSLFWSPCAAYCIDKMLEDISKQVWVSTVLEEANTITRYVYSHSWIKTVMRKFTGGMELIRPRINRLVSKFLSLRSIVIHEDNLKHMFSHREWISSNYSRRPDAQVVKTLLFLTTFWKSAREVVSISEQLIKVLRIVDGDMPAMGYVYEGIERAKDEIKSYYKNIEEKYMPIWEIIDRRWNMQLHSPLHEAAAFLNPSIIYNPRFKIDLRMRNGFQEAMMKMAIEDKDKIEITKEHPVYINAQGALGTNFAVLGRTLNAPGDWWAGYGYEVPTIQRVAMRILNQPCSSHWCRINRSTFERVHSKKRNKLQEEKLCDLVYVHCNLRLQAMLNQNRYGKCKPIIFDEIDVSLEWPTELETSKPPLLDDSWLDSLPFDSRGSP